MKKLITIMAICLMVAMTTTNKADAQKQYAFGSRVSLSLTSSTTVSVTPANTLTFYTLSADTSITFNAVTSKSLPGDRFVLKVTANRIQRKFTFGTNFHATLDSIASTKVKLYEFIYNGTDYDILSKQLTN